MLITLIFLVVAMKSRTFSSFSCSANEQVCWSWGERSQTGSQAGQWKYSIPQASRSAYEWGLAVGQKSFFLASVGSNPLLFGSSNFSRSLVCFTSLAKFTKSMGSGFCNRCSGTDWREDCVVYSLFCIFVIVIITIITSSCSIFFVVLLNCLYLNP